MTALKQSQIDQLTKKLNEENQALLREVRNELENSGDQHRIDILNSEPGDTGDESMANALADFNVARLDRHIQGMRDIEAAFQRIKEGTYGVCVDCGDDIALERLRAWPTAKRCHACQQQRERTFSQEGTPRL